jgi:hypothetical protein
MKWLTLCCNASMLSADRLRDDGILYETPICENCGCEFPEMIKVEVKI